MVTQPWSGAVVLWALWNCSREPRRQLSTEPAPESLLGHLMFARQAFLRGLPTQGHEDGSTCMNRDSSYFHDFEK